MFSPVIVLTQLSPIFLLAAARCRGFCRAISSAQRRFSGLAVAVLAASLIPVVSVLPDAPAALATPAADAFLARYWSGFVCHPTVVQGVLTSIQMSDLGQGDQPPGNLSLAHP